MRARPGFSLLELSVVLTIIALIIAISVTAGSEMVGLENRRSTEQQLDQISNALKRFYEINGYLPCPAGPTILRGEAEYGEPSSDCSDATPINGVARYTYPASNYIRVGAIPYKALNLSESLYTDSWGNLLRYAVDEEYTAGTATGSATKHIEINGPGGVSVLDDVAFIVLSHGATGAGAYVGGTRTIGKTCPASTIDAENCDADGLFVDARYYDGTTAANFNDDLVRWGELPLTTATGCTAETVSVGGNPDDGEEWANGYTNSTDTDIEMGQYIASSPSTNEARIGAFRFKLDVPKGAVVTSAKIQFHCAYANSNSSSVAVTLRIQGQAADNALGFPHGSSNNISSRTKTTAYKDWAVGTWSSNAQGAAQLSEDFKDVVTEIVGRSGWVKGNSAAFFFTKVTASGFRSASSADTGDYRMPKLLLTYNNPNGPCQ